MFTRTTVALVLLLSPPAARAQIPDRYSARIVSFPDGVTGRPDIAIWGFCFLPELPKFPVLGSNIPN